MVKISMDTFVKRFQPDKYEDWINGTDIGPHPEDPVTEAAAAPIPSEQDILVNKKYVDTFVAHTKTSKFSLSNHFSNVDVPEPVIQSLKKKCNPSLKTKSFKERNPDLDMEEIQNNPNIPDDIKAVLSGSVLDETDGTDEPVESLNDGVEAMIQEKYDNILNEDSDEEIIQRRRGRKGKKDDDDWFATKKERMDREKQINGPRPRGRPKRKSDDGASAGEEKAKRKKATPRKKDKDESTPKKKDDATSKKKDDATSKKKDESNRKSTDGSKPERSKATKKPPALPFNLDSSKKFEGKIPSLKNNAQNQAAVADSESAKNVIEQAPKTNIDKMNVEKSTLGQSHSQSAISSIAPPSSTVTCSSGSLKQTTSMQNGLLVQARTALSSTISSKDVKPCDITQRKYSLKV